MKKNYVLIILLGLFCIANVGAAGKNSFSDGGGILYTQPLKSVIFRHQYHVDVKKISCEKCHSGLFEMEALRAQENKDFIMESLYRGKYCGACHNGKNAFDSETQCARCHVRISEKDVGHVKGKIKPYQFPVYNTNVPLGKNNLRVVFQHEKHSAPLSCSDCHSKIFQIKKGTNKITLLNHKPQKYCFNCHNGDKAFSRLSCDKCHKDWKEIAQYGPLKPKADRGSCVKCHTNPDEMKSLVKPPPIGGEAEG